MSSEKTISFVIPVFNSEAILPELFTQITDASEANGYIFEILFVNDGSTDHSFEVISELCEKYPGKAKGIDLTKNFGQHNATLCGLEFSTGNYIVTLDDDLQFSPHQAFELLEDLQKQNLDFIYGIPKKRNHSLRRFLGRQFLFWGSTLGSKKIAGASFRIITRAIVNQL